MKVQLQSQTVLILVAMAVVGVGGFMLYRKARAVGSAAVDTAKEAAWAVTPWNNDNVIYGGVNSAGAAITGDNNFSLGGWIYDKTHSDPMAPVNVGVTGGW